MEILVLIKKVPDPNLPAQFITLSADGQEVQLHPSSQYSVNLYDLNAVECAVALKEQHGGAVTVMTADDASGEQYLRRAIGMGADRAIRVDLPAESRNDGFAVAAALAEAIREAGPVDLIIAGRASSDADTGLVPHLVAEALAMPSLGPVVAIDSLTPEQIVIGKLADTTLDHYELALPATIMVSNEINKPRTPSIKGVMASKKAKIEVIAGSGAALGLRPTYALKGQGRSAATVTYAECSDDEKAAALLAALGQ